MGAVSAILSEFCEKDKLGCDVQVFTNFCGLSLFILGDSWIIVLNAFKLP